MRERVRKGFGVTIDLIEPFSHFFITILQVRVDSVTPVPRIKKGLDVFR